MRAGTRALTGVGVTAAPTFGRSIAAYVFTPVIYAGDAATLDYFAAALPTLAASSRVAFEAKSMPMRQVAASSRGSKRTILAAALLHSLDRVFETRYRIEATRHLAAVALALRLYAADHAGRLPPTLAALVPDYVPAIPLDAIDGLPLRFDATRAIAWSVGADGTDDGGDETVRRPQFAGDLWQMRDAVIHLTPTTRPATQPSR